MPIYIGEDEIKDFFIGEEHLFDIYIGEDLVWEAVTTFCDYEMNSGADSTGNNGDLPHIGSFDNGKWTTSIEGRSAFAMQNLFNQTDYNELIVESRFMISSAPNNWVTVYEFFTDNYHRMFNLINCTAHHIEIGGYDSNGTVFDKSASCEDLVYNEWITMKIIYQNSPQKLYSVYINGSFLFTVSVTNNFPVIQYINWNDLGGPYDGTIVYDYFRIYGK